MKVLTCTGKGVIAIFKRAVRTGTRNIVTTESKLGIWGDTLQGEGIARKKNPKIEACWHAQGTRKLVGVK